MCLLSIQNRKETPNCIIADTFYKTGKISNCHTGHADVCWEGRTSRGSLSIKSRIG